MRLLAHGGTEHAERRRIGEWPAISVGSLQDREGLRNGELIFGCGVRDENPFLIFRLGLKRDTRLYAYSLLLDPGFDVWQHFDWNAASLILALFGETPEAREHSLGAELLTHPESFNDEKLSSLLQHLLIHTPQTKSPLLFQPDIDQAFSEFNLPKSKTYSGPQTVEEAKSENQATDEVETDDLQKTNLRRASTARQTEAEGRLLDVWFAAIPLVEPLAIAPENLPLTLKQIEALLQALPKCFRIGSGWMVGGSELHAEPFGTHLVLLHKPEDSESSQELESRGNCWRTAWYTLRSHPKYAELISKREREFIWQWPPDWKNSLTETFNRLALLAQMLNRSTSVDEILKLVETEVKEGGALEGELYATSHQLALCGEEPMSEFRTHFLLHCHLFHAGLPLPEKYQARLDEAEVIKFYLTNRLYPDNEHAPKFSAALRYKIWKETVLAEENAFNIAPLLKHVVEDLNRFEPLPDLHPLALDALRRSVTLANSLDPWRNYKGDEMLDPLISDWLADEAIRRTIAQTNDTLDEYWLFGKDAGGGKLLQKDSETALRVFRKTLREWKTRKNREAEKWLRELATSELRDKIPLQAKLELSETLAGKWTSLKTLRDLYLGNHTTAGEAAVSNQSEWLSLVSELREMAAQDQGQKIDFIPRLYDLSNFLSRLPDECLEALAALRPRLNLLASQNWVDDWEKISPSGVYQDEFIRYAIESNEIVKAADVANLLPEKRTELFRQLLFVHNESQNPHLLNQLINLLRRTSQGLLLREHIAQAFNDCASDQAQETFARMFHQRQTELDILFAELSESHRQRAIMLLLKEYPDWVADRAYWTFKTSTQLTFEKTPFRISLLRFLLSPEGKEIKADIDRHLHSRNGAESELHIKKMLKEPREEVSANGEAKKEERSLVVQTQEAEKSCASVEDDPEEKREPTDADTGGSLADAVYTMVKTPLKRIKKFLKN